MITEKELWKYHGKKVKITTLEGKTFIGFAAYFTSIADSEEENEASITIERDFNENVLIEFTQSEIETILTID